MPKLLLRLEGAVVFCAATAVYFHQDNAWWLYLVLALAPDLAIIGYAASTRVGALTYNTVHTYALPVTLAAAGVLSGAEGLVAVCLIWIAHIGADRALGYGLKYPTDFKETHLQRV